MFRSLLCDLWYILGLHNIVQRSTLSRKFGHEFQLHLSLLRTNKQLLLQSAMPTACSLIIVTEMFAKKHAKKVHDVTNNYIFFIGEVL